MRATVSGVRFGTIDSTSTSWYDMLWGPAQVRVVS